MVQPQGMVLTHYLSPEPAGEAKTRTQAFYLSSRYPLSAKAIDSSRVMRVMEGRRLHLHSQRRAAREVVY